MSSAAQTGALSEWEQYAEALRLVGRFEARVLERMVALSGGP